MNSTESACGEEGAGLSHRTGVKPASGKQAVSLKLFRQVQGGKDGAAPTGAESVNRPTSRAPEHTDADLKTQGAGVPAHQPIAQPKDRRE